MACIETQHFLKALSRRADTSHANLGRRPDAPKTTIGVVKMRQAAILVGIAAAGLMIPSGVTSVSAMTLRVSATGGSCSDAKFTTVQDAINAARPRDKVVVCAGIYDEQLLVDKPLSIRGNSGAVVRPSGMVANTTSLRTGQGIASVVVVTAKAKLSGLEIDASENDLGCGTADPNLIGVFFRGASGSLKGSKVHGTMLGDVDLSCDSGAAVLVQGGAGPINVSVVGNQVFDYQRAGIVVNEVGARAVISANMVTGLGPTPAVAQNGIQVGFGGFAKIMKNVVQNNASPSTGSCTFDGGNLVFEAEGGLIANNTFTGNTAGVFISGSRNRIKKNRLNGLSEGVAAGLDGILLIGDTNVLLKNVVNDMSAVGIRVLGSENRVTGNTIVATRAENLCESARATPGCAEVLDVCGVGVWIANGTGNSVTNNTLVQNDMDLLDEGLGTKVRGNKNL